MQDWKPTRDGGFRRTRVAQVESPGQINQETVGRNHPRVLRAAWAEKLGLPECPYVIRWRIEFPFGSVRVHHWLSSDDPRAFHDHPWWFITLVLKGGYADQHPGGWDHLGAGSVRFRPALHRHTVIPDPGGAWTLLVTGRVVRPWGFWPRGVKFV